MFPCQHVPALLLLGSTKRKASSTTSCHLAQSKPAQPNRSQYQLGNLIRRGPSFQLLQATCLGQSQEDPCEDTSSLLFMCLQNSCSCCRKCLAPAQQAQQQARGSVRWVCQPLQSTARGRTFSTAGPSPCGSHVVTGQRTGGKPMEMGNEGSWTYCICDRVKAMTVLSGSPKALKSL